MSKNKFVISDTYCCKCGQKGISIPRKNGQYREPGHLKKLYCIFCDQEQNHVEIRPICSEYNLEDFELEFEYHNFDEDGNRIEPYKVFKENLKKAGII